MLVRRAPSCHRLPGKAPGWSAAAHLPLVPRAPVGRVVARGGAGGVPGARAAPRSPTARAQQAPCLSRSLGSDTKRRRGKSRLDSVFLENTHVATACPLPSLTAERAAGSACALGRCAPGELRLHVVFVLRALPGARRRLCVGHGELLAAAGASCAAPRPRCPRVPVSSAVSVRSSPSARVALDWGHRDDQWPSCPHRRQELLTVAPGRPPPKHSPFFCHFCFHTWGHKKRSRGKRR